MRGRVGGLHTQSQKCQVSSMTAWTRLIIKMESFASTFYYNTVSVVKADTLLLYRSCKILLIVDFTRQCTTGGSRFLCISDPLI